MKIKKKLIIINLSKNYKYEINESNCDCINISSGQIDVGKSNILDFLKIRKKYINIVKKTFINSYLKKILQIKKKYLISLKLRHSIYEMIKISL